MTIEELATSAANDPEPPADLSPESKAMWYAKAGQWDAAHDIAQDIDTPLGSWIHALLHLIEGDSGNAGYWFSRAGKKAKTPGQIDQEWNEIAGVTLSQ